MPPNTPTPDPFRLPSVPKTAGSTGTPPIVLSIAGFDPSGGAGVLADLKTFAAHGVYGMACVTAWTVQSTQGVRRVEALDPQLVTETLECLASDVQFSAIKIGMLGEHKVAMTVLDWLAQQTAVDAVLDPVLQSSSGMDLLDNGGLKSLREKWLARVNWITPNIMELAALTGTRIPATAGEIEDAAAKLQSLAASLGNAGLRIAVTGGHSGKPDDLLLTPESCRWYPGEHVDTVSTHGTGCAFSSSLAALLARGEGDDTAMRGAKSYVAGALRQAYPVGQGNGPVNHLWRKRC